MARQINDQYPQKTKKINNGLFKVFALSIIGIIIIHILVDFLSAIILGIVVLSAWLIVKPIIVAKMRQKEEEIKAQEANLAQATKRYRQTEKELAAREKEAKKADQANMDKVFSTVQAEVEKQKEISVQIPQVKYTLTRIENTGLRYKMLDDICFEIERLNTTNQNVASFKRNFCLSDGTRLSLEEADELRNEMEEILQDNKKLLKKGGQI